MVSGISGSRFSRRLGRRGYVHTLEAFIAFFVTFIFVVFIVSTGVSSDTDHADLGVLLSLEQRDDFRSCVYSLNSSCVEELADPLIPSTYMFKVLIDEPEPFKGAKDIYTETVFVVANQTGIYRTVYLYYWFADG